MMIHSRVVPLSHPSDGLVARLELVAGAKRRLDLQYYLWDSDAVGYLLLSRLIAATDRGVSDHSDDEIAAIGRSICEYFGAHPLPAHSNATTPERMEANSNAAVIIAEGLGMPYDPALQDAGFEDGIDARNVMAFKYTLEPAGDGGLCPVPTSGPGSMPCSVSGCQLFGSPWSAAASVK